MMWEYRISINQINNENISTNFIKTDYKFINRKIKDIKRSF